MTTVEYDELTDRFYATCHDCPWEGRPFDRERDADQDADRHDEHHEEGP